jgi:hypothetical protein
MSSLEKVLQDVGNRLKFHQWKISEKILEFRERAVVLPDFLHLFQHEGAHIHADGLQKKTRLYNLKQLCYGKLHLGLAKSHC